MSETLSTFAYLEEEARHEHMEIRLGDRPPIRMPSRVRNGGFHPTPIATLTPEQARAAGWELYKAIVDLDQVLAERGQLTDAVIVNVWGSARAAVRRASKIEAVAALEPVDGSGPQRESETTAAEGHTSRADSTERPT
jgi:hypothetical protein